MAVVMKKTGSQKSNKRASSQFPPERVERPDGIWHRVATRAYELWEARGRRDGYAVQDWLDAEQSVMEEIHEARG